MRRLLSLVSAAMVLSVAGCHTCDVCDDCGDGCGSCGSNNSYHSRAYGDPGFAPGYVTPEYEGTVTNSQKRIPMQTLPTKAKSMQAAKGAEERIVR